MKNLTRTILASFLAFTPVGAFANEWSPIGIEWGFGWLPQETTNVYGLRLGLMCGNHTVRGVGQIGVCNCARNDWKGLQIGLVNYIEDSWMLPLVNGRF